MSVGDRVRIGGVVYDRREPGNFGQTAVIVAIRCASVTVALESDGSEFRYHPCCLTVEAA